MSLATLDPTACPDCGGPTETTAADQPALLRHGGYGAARRDAVRWCPGCGWALHHETSEVRP